VFQFPENPFDGVPISVATRLKSESSSLQRGLEVLRAVNEKDGGFNIVFLLEFAEEDLGSGGRGRRKQSHVKQLVGLWVCGGIQPELLVVDSNHCFIERDLIRRSARLRL